MNYLFVREVSLDWGGSNTRAETLSTITNRHAGHLKKRSGGGEGTWKYSRNQQMRLLECALYAR